MTNKTLDSTSLECILGSLRAYGIDSTEREDIPTMARMGVRSKAELGGGVTLIVELGDGVTSDVMQASIMMSGGRAITTVMQGVDMLSMVESGSRATS